MKEKFTPHLGLQFVDCDGKLVRSWQLLGSDGKAVSTMTFRGKTVERFDSCFKAPWNASDILIDADKATTEIKPIQTP